MNIFKDRLKDLRTSLSLTQEEFAKRLGISKGKTVEDVEKDIKDYFGWDSTDFLDSGMTPWIDFNLWHVDATDNSPWIGKISYTWPPEFSEEGNLLAYGYYPYPTE